MVSPGAMLSSTELSVNPPTVIRSKTNSTRFGPEKRGGNGQTGRRFARKQSGDARVGSGDFGGQLPGRRTRHGRVAVGLWRQSDEHSGVSRAAIHLNRGEHAGPDGDRRPSFG